MKKIAIMIAGVVSLTHIVLVYYGIIDEGRQNNPPHRRSINHFVAIATKENTTEAMNKLLTKRQAVLACLFLYCKGNNT